MTEHELTLLEIKATMENLDPADQEATQAAARELRTWLENKGDAGHMALALVGAELAAR